MGTREQSVDTSTAALGEVVDLRINCTRCGGELEVQCTNWQTNGPLEAHRFACPYCSQRNDLRFPARLMWVSVRGCQRTLAH
jgi:transcription elongation factor Elf1